VLVGAEREVVLVGTERQVVLMHAKRGVVVVGACECATRGARLWSERNIRDVLTIPCTESSFSNVHFLALSRGVPDIV
jgi:hypothetical protein